MAIVKMNEFMLLAFEEKKNSLLEKLQSFENVEFSDLNTESSEEYTELKQDSASIEISEVEGHLSKLGFTIDLLSKFDEKPNMLKAMKEGKKAYSYNELEKIASSFRWDTIYKELQQKDKKINQNENYISKLKGNISELEPWVAFDTEMDKLNGFKASKALIGLVPAISVESLRLDLEAKFNETYLEIISKEGKDANVMVISHKDQYEEVEQELKSHNFSKVDLHCDTSPKEAINNYEETISQLRKENSSIEEEMKSYLTKLNDIKAVYEYYSSSLIRLKSSEKFLRSNSIVAITGYYPTELHNQLVKALTEVLGDDYYLESKAADGDDVPVKLKNNAVFESFESITTMYSVPRYKEIDPTPLFAPFYILFFGMMLSDAGYGAIMLIGTAVALMFFNLDEDMRKSMKMFFALSISTIFWGVMYGSYFGNLLEKHIPAVWMKPDTDVTLLMLVSIGLGLIQILVGLGIKGYMQIRDKDYFGAFSDVFLWYVTLIGCIIWGGSAFGVSIPATIVTVAKYGAIASMVGIVLTNGRAEPTIGGKLGQGFYSLYGITGYVGDLVSYSRLAALGLATGFISYAFNVMVNMVSTNIFTTIIFGGLIFVVGHIFNLFINALGSYVHACRLQYLEYFGKFYEGGGKAFEPLRYNSKYFKIMRDKN